MSSPFNILLPIVIAIIILITCIVCSFLIIPANTNFKTKHNLTQ